MKTDKRFKPRLFSIAAIAVLVFGIFAVITTPFNLAIAQIEAEPTLVGQEEIRARILEAERNPPDVEALGKELERVRATQKTSNQVPFQYPKECGWTEITCGMLKALNWLVDSLAAVPLSLVRSFFVSILSLNFTAFSEGQFLTATTTGWRIVLGVVNMFFVLWLLWIAIATIFSFEPFTYKQLLWKIIIAALLINFSFGISTAVISLANNLGLMFWNTIDQMGGVNSVLAKIGNPDAFVLTVENMYSGSRDEILNRQISVPTFLGSRSITVRDCPKIASVKLTSPLAIIQGYSELSTVKLQEECQKLMTDADIAQALTQDDAGNLRDSQLAVAVVVKLFVYPIAIFALLAAAIFLVIRIVSLMLLIVSAPLAFFMLAIPGGGQAGFGWTDWWQYLFKWSFYLPVFMFVFMLSAIVLNNVAPESFKIAISGKGAIPSAPMLFLQYLIGIILLIVSIMVAKNMSMYGANTAVKWGSGIAGAAGKWAKGTGKIFAGKTLEPVLKSRPAQALASSRYTRWALRPLETGIQAGAKVSEQREKARIARRAAVVSAAGITDINANMRGMRNDEERVKFMKELRKTDRLTFEAAVPNVPLPLMRSTYQEAQRRHEDELAEQLVTRARDFNTRLQIITGLDPTHPNFQQAANAQLAAMKSEMLQRIVSADDIRDANGVMNPHLENALLHALDIDAFRTLGNTAEKGARLSEYFADQLGGRRAFIRAQQTTPSISIYDATMQGIDAAIANLEATNKELADKLKTLPAVKINLAYGRPLVRRASALPVAGIPPPAPATP